MSNHEHLATGGRGYLGQTHQAIVATLATLRHFQAFLASDCRVMHDPYERNFPVELNKRQAERKLHWLIQVAINRKAGVPESRGRYDTDDSQRHLRLLAQCINTPRLIVRRTELGEWGRYLLARIPERFWMEE